MLFNGKYYNKPGHLGMTRQQVKDALAGGAATAALQPIILPGDATVSLDNADMTTLTGGGLVSKTVPATDFVEFKDATPFHEFVPMFLAVDVEGIYFYMMPLGVGVWYLIIELLGTKYYTICELTYIDDFATCNFTFKTVTL